MRSASATIAILFAAVVMAMSPSPGRTEESVPFRPTRVVPAFPAIKDAPFISAEAATRVVRGDELVLGVTVTGKDGASVSRAYPINMLTSPKREIINDTLNGVPLAATW